MLYWMMKEITSSISHTYGYTPITGGFCMQINKITNGSELTIALVGRLDTNSSPALEKELTTALNGVGSLIFDLAELGYISSAGLRVLLMAQKAMNAKAGSMVIRNSNEDIMSIFDVTGFVDILNIED